MTTEPEFEIEDGEEDDDYDPWEDHECGRDCYGYDEEDDDEDDEG